MSTDSAPSNTTVAAFNAPAPNLHLTDAAVDKIAALIRDENNPKLNLRVYITGGGCSGYQYGFSFDEVINDDDTVISRTGTDNLTPVRVLIDCMSITLLAGAEIDYTSGIQEQFIIRNPNAKTTCGCGSSFSVADDGEF